LLSFASTAHHDAARIDDSSGVFYGLEVRERVDPDSSPLHAA